MEKTWDKFGKELLKTTIFYALDANKRKFFVYRDDSTIVFLVMDKSQTTFAIPKKYCKVVGDHYVITDYNKMIPVSCPSKNNYEKFIYKYFIA